MSAENLFSWASEWMMALTLAEADVEWKESHTHPALRPNFIRARELAGLKSQQMRLRAAWYDEHALRALYAERQAI